MKKKILFLVPLPPPIYGAAVSSKLCLKSKVLNRAFDIEHVKLNYSRILEDVGKLNPRKLSGFFIVFSSIFKKIISFKPDLIYFTIAPSGSGFLRDSLFVALCKLFRKRIIFHLRGRIKQEMENPFKRLFYKLVFRKTKVIILSEYLYEDVEGLVTKKDMFVLPNAIENEVSSSEFKKNMKSRKKRKSANILFLSNMDETKGPLILLKACKLLKDQKIDFKCNFVGAWADVGFKEKFESYIHNNKLDDMVSYLGIKTGEEKKRVLRTSDMLVFPTYYKLETFGLVILEAMEHGLPVIANGIASIPSIVVHGKTGFILKKNDPEELVGYIKFLINNKSTAIKFGERGRERFLKNYSFAEYELKLKSVLEKSICRR